MFMGIPRESLACTTSLIQILDTAAPTLFLTARIAAGFLELAVASWQLKKTICVARVEHDTVDGLFASDRAPATLALE